MTDASHRFEVRATTATGEHVRFVPFSTHAAASAYAHQLLQEGRAVRVEVLRHAHGQAQLLSVIGQRSRKAGPRA